MTKTRKGRALFFISAVFLFLVTAPVSLLYTAGYRWSSETGLTKTGTFLFETTPRDATITINGELLKDKTPSIVKRVPPGTHNIKFELEGHESWEKNLEIKSGSTTFAEAVILFASVDSKLLLKEQVSQAAISPNGDSLAWIEESNGWIEVWTRSTNRDDSQLVHRQSQQSLPIISWRDNSTIKISSFLQTQYINTQGDTVAIDSPSSNLEILNQNSQSVINKNGEPIVRLPIGDYTIADAHQSFAIIEDSTQSRIALIDATDSTSPLLLFEEAIDWQWLGSQTLLFADSYGIHIFDANSSSTETIVRLSEQITETLWVDEHPGYVFYSTHSGVYAIEIDSRDGHKTTRLTNVDKVFGFGLGSNGRSLIFAGEKGFDKGWFTRPLFMRSLPDDENLQDSKVNF